MNRLLFDLITRGGGVPQLPSIAGLTADLDSRIGLFKDTAGTLPATLDNDAVALWKDQSGGARDFQQGSASLQPYLKPDTLAGYPTVEFAAGDYVLGLAASNYITNTTFTWYIVFRAENIGTNVTTAGSVYTNHTLLAVGGGYAGMVLLSGTPSFGAYNYTPPEVSIVDRAIALNSWYAGYAQHASGNLKVSLGNGTEGSAVSGNTGLLTAGLQLGAPVGGAAKHRVARLLVYNTAHTPTEKLSVMEYLNALYGVAV